MIIIRGEKVTGTNIIGDTTLEGANYRLGQALKTCSDLFQIAISNGNMELAQIQQKRMYDLQTDINVVFEHLLAKMA